MRSRSSGVEGVPEPLGLLVGQPGTLRRHFGLAVVSASMDWPFGYSYINCIKKNGRLDTHTSTVRGYKYLGRATYQRPCESPSSARPAAPVAR